MGSSALQVGVELDRVRGDDMQQGRHVHGQDGQADDGQGYTVLTSDQPQKPIPKRDHGASMVGDECLRG